MRFIFKNKFALILTLVFCFIITGFNSAFAQYKAPKPVGYVNDFAHVLDENSVAKLNGVIKELYSKTSAEVAVVTLTSLDGYPIEDVGLAIGRQWGVGQKGKDNGVVIVTAINDRKMRIEVGYGIEGFLTDAHAGRIRDTYMLPYFKTGDYQSGIIYGTTAVVDAIAKGYGVTVSGNYTLPQPISSQDSGSDLGSWIIIILLVFLFIRYPSFMIGFFLGSMGDGRGSGGGFGGGSGFGGFGGGGFGGGGASGGW